LELREKGAGGAKDQIIWHLEGDKFSLARGKIFLKFSVAFPLFPKEGQGRFIRVLRYNPQLKGRARSLRLELTDAEQRLWARLRRKQILGMQFYRQKPIGNYIVDFYAPSVRLVVEVDGSQHFDPSHAEYDKRRTAYLEGLGLRVLRYTDRQVLLELDSVAEEIFRVVDGTNPP
jgi:very-short-patch-repair endonuclease